MFPHRIAILLLALALPAHSATLFVSPDGTGADGLSWNTAFPTIGQAIVASTTDDEIWIRSATYVENITIERPLTLLGGFVGSETLGQRNSRDPSQHPTVIDGNRNGSVVRAKGPITLDGFSIVNGLARLEDGDLGSGLLLSDATATLTRLKLSGNGEFTRRQSSGGGGMYAENSTIRMTDCLMTKNLAGEGGGAMFTGCAIEVRDSLIGSNRGWIDGAGLYIRDGSSVFLNTEISDNLVNGGDGGGCYIESGHAAFLGCQFLENVVYHFSPGPLPVPFLVKFGGAVACYRVEEVRFVNSLFTGNRGTGVGLTAGSVLYSKDSEQIHFTHCTIIALQYASFSAQDQPIHIENSLVVGQDLDRILQPSPVSYSLIEGGHQGEGNIDADPLFVDPKNGDYRLRYGSPCIDAGAETDLMIDLDGNPRPVDIIGLGCDGPDTFDMGAYEFQSPRSDLNGDGYVNHLDLMILQQDWGKVSGP
ncbi:MAG: right-handed parallel beta-helix repeat-containing protein [Candidatus Omnitrophica bacterium]|nr:right-handed parallel beta-helix repeat-containing protein [Candidatus Omnitrophota bacterium]